ncbi:MAG: inositol monophosphatase family protein [Solirubrobacteraceae bacterium]
MPRASDDELLAVARAAAQAAAAELRARFGHRAEGVRAKSSPTDPVSDADLAAEAAIRSLLLRERPRDSILGEEGGATGGEAELRWVVDPLDGTVNFLYGIPTFAVSVACEDGAGAIAGVVLDPLRGECFAATRSGVATLNGEPIRCSTRTELARALIATGFAYEASVRARQAQVAARLLPRVRDIRRAGAASLDLCACACGRVDAYYERGLRPWDHAAGSLICARAGARVRRLEAQGPLPDGLLVAPGALIDSLYELVANGTDGS